MNQLTTSNIKIKNKMSDQVEELVIWLKSHQSWFQPQIFDIILNDFHNELDIAEYETLILDELVELTILELQALRDLGWFESVDIEENDGMLFLMGEPTSKFCQITQLQLQLQGQISFFAEDGHLQFDNGQSIDRQEFKKLIDLSEAYYQISYRRY